MIKKILSFVLVLLLTLPLSAQKKQLSYEYQRAVEALTEHNDEEKAIEYFQKDLTKDPKNGYSWYWMSVVYYNNSRYGDALETANNALRYIPSSDKAYQGSLNSVLCDIYLCLGDTVKAIERIENAIKIDKQSESFRGKRAYIYLNKGEFSKARKDFGAMLKINEASAPAWVGLGRVDLYEGRNAVAIEKFTKAINLNSSYQAAYSWRALVYELDSRYMDALADHISALYLGYSSFDYTRLRYISSIIFPETISRLRSVASKDKTNWMWYYIIGQLYRDDGQYEAAIEAYKESVKIEESDYILSRIADCYIELGNYYCALKYIKDAIVGDEKDPSYYVTLANIHDLMGQYENALKDFDDALKVSDERGKYMIYHRRGWIKMHNNDQKGALKDFNKSMLLEKDYSYNYLCRGMIYSDLDMEEEASRDFNMILSLEKDTNSYSARPFALFYLGQYTEAKRSMSVMLRNGGSLYDAACLYSLLQETTMSLDYLEKALHGGYRNFVHINRDHDLNNVRNNARFKELLEQYKSLPIVGDCGQNSVYKDTTVYIPFEREGGVYKVKCLVNGLPLNFIFDTGADDVCLSSSEASMMFKQGYLGANDVKGNSRFRTADGTIAVGTIVSLMDVELGGIHLSDVSATIVNNDNAPALLGQSVLRRFGSVEIDYEKKQIKLIAKIPALAKGSGFSESHKDAKDGVSELVKLLKGFQSDMRRTSKYQTSRDAVAYEAGDALKGTAFYNKYCKDGSGLQSENTSIRDVSILYRSTLNLIRDFINGDIDDLDFSQQIEQSSSF